MEQERTHFGPEETEISTHDMRELSNRKKNQFKSDLLQQIEVRLSYSGTKAKSHSTEAIKFSV